MRHGAERIPVLAHDHVSVNFARNFPGGFAQAKPALQQNSIRCGIKRSFDGPAMNMTNALMQSRHGRHAQGCIHHPPLSS
jgi:hypothetical protein